MEGIISMKSKTKKTFLMAFVAVALPISLMASTLLTSNKFNPFNFVKGVANVESGNHYARIDKENFLKLSLVAD